MLRTLLVFLFLIACHGVTAQDTEIYYFKNSAAIVEYDIIKDQPTSDTMVAQKNWRFTVDRATLTGYIITFVKWVPKPENEVKNQTFYEKESVTTDPATKKKIVETERMYFFITKEEYAEFTAVYVDNNPKYSFVTGAMIVPIKIRPGSDDGDTGSRKRPYDFSSDFNIGISAGLRIRLEKKGHHHLNIIGGISITSVAVDSETTGGFMENQTNAAALTINSGLIYEYKDFQAGLIMGWDRLSRELGENWVYQGKPWFGLGIGYNIFNSQESTTTQP